MIRKLHYGLMALVLMLAAMAGTAAAHEHESSGSISAVLHVEPSDVVTTGVPAVYEIEFHDTTNKFKLSDCGCTIVTKHDEKVVASDSLRAANDDTATGSLVFPNTGEDEVEVIGEPINPGSFTPFDLEFPVNVKAARSNWALWYGLGAVGVVVLVVGVSAVAFRRKR